MVCEKSFKGLWLYSPLTMVSQVRELANRTGMDFSEQIAELEDKYDQVHYSPVLAEKLSPEKFLEHRQ